jgi:hypothetical protein
MTTKKATGTLAAAVLAVGALVSVATATRPCNPRVCSDEILAACGPRARSREYRACRRSLLRNCRTTACTCDGSGTPCGAGSPSGAFVD